MRKQFNVKNLLMMAGAVLAVGMAGAQTQKGADIDGETARDQSGFSVSMPDAGTVAIGAYWNNGNGTGMGTGQVRVYSWNGSSWIQKGSDINGENLNDRLGFSVSMPDANTLAAGAYLNDGAGSNAGLVRVYFWYGNKWFQLGGDIGGEAAEDYSGRAVCMPDAQTVAIGAIGNDGNGNNSGHVRVYRWNGSSWVQKGADINGEADQDGFGASVSMPDANTLAVGADGNDGTGTDAGHVRVFSWNGSAWVQKGTDIDGEAAFDKSGSAVCMPDANTLAIGAAGNGDNFTNIGHVRVYTWNGSGWIQKGVDINGDAPSEFCGYSVSMPDANTLAIGATGAAGNGLSSGRVRVYRWDGAAWVQKGTDMNGESAYDFSGRSVSMPDANTLAVGAEDNDGAGTDAGHVRVYSFESAGMLENEIGPVLKVFPNPTHGETTIDLGAGRQAVSVVVRNAVGQEVLRQQWADVSAVPLNIPGEAGIYLVEVIADDKRALLKVIRK